MVSTFFVMGQRRLKELSSNRVHLSGFYCACPLGTLCGDPAGAFVWGGLVG
jgi:hypothetical protein